MITYHDAARGLIDLYADYVEVRVRLDDDYAYPDYSEEITVAIEALLVRADQEKTKAMMKNYQSQLLAAAPAPTIQPSVNEWIDAGKNLSDYPVDLNIFNSVSYKEN